MTVRWWFKEQRQPKRSRWTWRRMSVDGSIERISCEFGDYGAAVLDALRNGFQPVSDHWIVEGALTTTHFERGERAVVVPSEPHSDAKPPLPPVRRLKPRASVRKGLSSTVKGPRESEER
jgi:hypothetical protein